jgi:type I restriction enzyme, R subunit
LPPISRFGENSRSQKKKGVINKLLSFFEKYLGLGISALLGKDK